MNFTFNGIAHKLGFHYSSFAGDRRRPKDEIRGRGSLRDLRGRTIRTTCVIMRDTGKKDEKGFSIFEELSSDSSYRNPADKFEKASGRRVALQRALQAAGFNREFRQTTWEEYFKHHSDGKKINNQQKV